MEWFELIAKAIGLIATIFSTYKVFSKYIKKNTNSIDFQMRFGVGRNVKGLGCMRFFRRPGALSSRNEISNIVKQRLTHEIAKDVVHAYSIERRSHRFSRDTRDFVSLMVSMLILSLLVTAVVGLSNISDISPAKQPFASFTVFMLCACSCAFFGYVARSSPVEWCNRFVSFGVGYALSWSGGSSCWVGWGVSRDLVRMSRLR